LKFPKSSINDFSKVGDEGCVDVVIVERGVVEADGGDDGRAEGDDGTA
jgi:hypothetical protein